MIRLRLSKPPYFVPRISYIPLTYLARMIRFLSILFISISILPACQTKPAKDDTSDQGSSIQSSEPVPSQVGLKGMQGDSVLMFTIVNESHDGRGQIIVQMAQTPESFLLTKTPVASGAKYLSEDSFYLWTSGESFTWGKDSLIIATGILRR